MISGQMKEIREERSKLGQEIEINKESIDKIEMDIGIIKAEVLPFEQI